MFKNKLLKKFLYLFFSDLRNIILTFLLSFNFSTIIFLFIKKIKLIIYNKIIFYKNYYLNYGE